MYSLLWSLLVSWPALLVADWLPSLQMLVEMLCWLLAVLVKLSLLVEESLLLSDLE